MGLSFTFFFLRHDHSLWTQSIFGGVRVAWNKSQKSLIVSTAGLFAWNLTSLTLCYYVIGLLHRVQTNHKTQNEKNVVPLWAAISLGEHCLTSQKTHCRGHTVWPSTEFFLHMTKFNSKYFPCMWKPAENINETPGLTLKSYQHKLLLHPSNNSKIEHKLTQLRCLTSCS